MLWKKTLSRCKRSAAVLMIFAMVVSMFPASVFALGGQWQGTASSDVVIKDTVTKLADSVYEHELITNNKAGDRQKIDYLCEVGKSSHIKIVAGYGQDDASKWSLTTTTKQAAAYEKNHPGETVVAGINADFFNMANGQPMGALVMEGKICNNANGRPYFGITKKGEAVIRQDNNLSDLETAVGGDVILINNGKPITENTAYGSIMYSRTAIGIKADGTVVTFVTYGLNPPTSCGRTYTDIAEMLASEGCVYALALDGGGSSTYAGRPEGTDKLEVRNSPNDGAERQVSSTILVVSTAEPTGVFSHAQLTPNNQVYTPGSEVKFEAKGVDTAGIGMPLPKDVKWTLAENSKALGTIDPVTGVFTAGSAAGIVTVNMEYQGKVVGETKIEVAVPDHIYFGTDEVSLGFEDRSDLGLVVRSKGRDMNYKVGDIKWTVSDPNMGRFEGNTFISADGVSLNGDVTATSSFDEKVFGKIKVIVGKLPTIVWDFEDVKNPDGSVIPAQDYYIGTAAKAGILSHSNYNVGGKESIEIASSDNDEPVRFGNHSLKLNYDFRNCGAVTEGACIGTTDSLTIPGVPTGIGVWVYAPEGVGIEYKGDGSQAGFWLRGYVRDALGNNKPYDFTLEPKNADVASGKVQPGIYWEGWKYLEADLTKLQAPFSIQPGMTMRLMYVSGIKMGTKTANSIYFDNLQFVYGANMDDIDHPYVASMQLNGAEFTDNLVVKTDTITVDAMLKDKEGKYATGIDDKTVRMYVDGVNVVGNSKYTYAYSEGDDRAQLSNLKLSDGKHSITVKAKDGFGNEVNQTKYFTVDTGAVSTGTNVKVVPATDKAVIGKTIDLQIVASDDTVAESTTIFKLGNQFKDYKVIFGDKYEGTYKYNKLDKTITVTAKRKAASPAGLFARLLKTDTVIATLSINVPADMKEADAFNYTVKGGMFETTSGDYNTYSSSEQKVKVGSDYQISTNTVINGGKPAEIKVTDMQGQPAKDVSLYMSGTNAEIGKTDAKGVLVTDQFNKAGAQAKDYVIYAKDAEGSLSFEYKLSVYASQGDINGLPHNVRFNTVKDAATQKNITWFSNPLAGKKQVLKYRVHGTTDWTTVDASVKNLTFYTAGNSSVDVNAVMLEGLKADTVYDYVTGAEGSFTAEETFKTGSVGKKTNEFFIVGDIQDPDKSRVQEVAKQLDAKNHNYDFGIQIGDAIDQAANYTDWSDLGEVLGAKMLGGTNMINIMGNHEYYGDTSAAIASAIYNSNDAKEGGCYSLEYNDVYVAVINFSSTTTPIKEAADWLVADAAKSKATWKILCMHQPAYYTNEGGNAPVYQYIPDAAEKAGIDAVFSGHDHSWAVTNPLTNDQIDEENGIRYYIVGAAGSKRYSASTQDKFDYNTIFKKVGEPFDATYLKVTSNQDEMTINVYDINQGLLDTVVLQSECKKKGHVHEFDAAKNKVVCSVCGRTINNFSGWATDKATGSKMNFINGKYQTGWVQIGEDVHYFNNKGLQQETTLVKDIKTDCITRGYKLYECKTAPENERTFRVRYQMAGGHEYKDVNGVKVCSVCGHKQINMSDCKIKLGGYDFTYIGRPIEPIFTVTAMRDGKEVVLKNGVDYYATIKNHTNPGEVTMTFTAQKVGIYVNVNEWRGNCAGSVDVKFTIHPELPRGASVVNNKTSATLNWQTSVSAQKYVIYQSVNGGAYKEIAAVTGNTYVVNNQDKNKTYRYRIGTRVTTPDGKTIDSIRKLIPQVIASEMTISNNDVDGKPIITLKNWDSNAKYELYRSESTDAKSFKSVGVMDKNGFKDANAVTGKTYYYKVKVTSAGKASFTGAYSATVLCGQPVVKTSADKVNGKPVITWDAVDEAVKYEVLCSRTGENGKFETVWSGKELSFTDADAKYGITSYYKVKAITGAGIEGALSKAVSQKCELFAPVLEKVTVNEAGKPVLNWSKVEGATEYKVFRAEAKDGKYTELASVKELTYTDKTAGSGETYFYKVAAAADSDQAFSNISEIKCPVGAPDVTAEVSADGKIILSWNNVKGATEYKVYMSESVDGEFAMLASTDKTSYTYDKAKLGNEYFFKVESLGNNTTAIGDAISVKCPVKAPVLELVGLDKNGKPQIKWAAVSGAVKYEVYRAAAGTGEFEKLGELTDCQYVDYDASENTDYEYKVRAVGEDASVYADSKTLAVKSGKIPVNVTRLDGSDRFKTAIKAAEQFKAVNGIEKFENVIVASGMNYVDALAGGYLAYVKKAPILLVNAASESYVADYIAKNISSNGKVYILGGDNAVPATLEGSLNGLNVERLAGKDRFETNIMILKAAGVKDEEILVCTAWNFADSLSASCAARPILVVGDKLYENQKDYLKSINPRNFGIIGGTNAIGSAVEGEIKAFASVERVQGANRYATSKAVIDRYFPYGGKGLVIASGTNFPDGLAGAPAAIAMYSPILLVDAGRTDAANSYMNFFGIKDLLVIGGENAVPGAVVDAVIK